MKKRLLMVVMAVSVVCSSVGIATTVDAASKKIVKETVVGKKLTVKCPKIKKAVVKGKGASVSLKKGKSFSFKSKKAGVFRVTTVCKKGKKSVKKEFIIRVGKPVCVAKGVKVSHSSGKSLRVTPSSVPSEVPVDESDETQGVEPSVEPSAVPSAEPSIEPSAAPTKEQCKKPSYKLVYDSIPEEITNRVNEAGAAHTECVGCGFIEKTFSVVRVALHESTLDLKEKEWETTQRDRLETLGVVIENTREELGYDSYLLLGQFETYETEVANQRLEELRQKHWGDKFMPSHLQQDTWDLAMIRAAECSVYFVHDRPRSDHTLVNRLTGSSSPEWYGVGGEALSHSPDQEENATLEDALDRKVRQRNSINWGNTGRAFTNSLYNSTGHRPLIIGGGGEENSSCLGIFTAYGFSEKYGYLPYYQGAVCVSMDESCFMYVDDWYSSGRDDNPVDAHYWHQGYHWFDGTKHVDDGTAEGYTCTKNSCSWTEWEHNDAIPAEEWERIHSVVTTE